MTTPPQYPAAPNPGDDFANAPPYAGGYQPQQPRQGNGLAIAGLVLGIVSVVLFLLNFLDLVIAVLAIVFSIIGLTRANRRRSGKGLAITGLVLGCVGLILAAAVTVIGVKARQRCEDHLGHTPNSAELRQCVKDGV